MNGHASKVVALGLIVVALLYVLIGRDELSAAMAAVFALFGAVILVAGSRNEKLRELLRRLDGRKGSGADGLHGDAAGLWAGGQLLLGAMLSWERRRQPNASEIENAWAAVHDVLPAGWVVDQPSYHTEAGRWHVTAADRRPGPERPDPIESVGIDEASSLRGLAERLRGSEMQRIEPTAARTQGSPAITAAEPGPQTTSDSYGGDTLISCFLLVIAAIGTALGVAFAFVLGRPLLSALVGAVVGVVVAIWVGVQIMTRGRPH